jgi:glycosyltransferase involved in cell wall biosynthesis
VVILDAWVLAPLVDAAEKAGVPTVFWSPIDQSPPPPTVISIGNRARLFACYSAWGMNEAREAGSTNARYVPLGTNTSVYCPMNRAQCRKAMDIDPEIYLVGMVAANSCPHSRKAWAQQMEGFGMFYRDHPEARLYIHADPHPAPGTGWRLDLLAKQYEIEAVTTFADPYQSLISYSEDQMRVLYNSFDVLLSASAGEGFGVPIIEAQACGTPVICGDWTSMPELFCGEGMKIQKEDAMKWRAPLGGYWYYPHPYAVADALDDVWQNRENEQQTSRQFIQDHYEVAKLTKDSLLPALEEAVGT